MEEKAAFISRRGAKVKLEYKLNNADMIKLWEAQGDRVVETTFDSAGAVLHRQLLKSSRDKIESMVQSELDSASIRTAREKPFEDIRLNKPCPSCGSRSLSNYSKSASGESLPVVPIYMCKSCSSRSYYLSKDYLEYLVKVNADMFSQGELSEYGKDNGAFIRELDSYILRIFASKKIARIR